MILAASTRALFLGLSYSVNITFQGHRFLFLWPWHSRRFAFGSLDPIRQVTGRGRLAPRPLEVGLRRQPELRHLAPLSCRLHCPEVLAAIPLLARFPAYPPRPRSLALGSGWPLSRTPGSPSSPLEPALTLTALPHAEAPAARGPLQARVRGARTAGAPTRGRWVRVPLPAAPSRPNASRLWSGPLISEAALWGLSSLLLPPSQRGRPPL